MTHANVSLQYIQVNTQRRARSAADHIASVDDLRNGLLLHPFIHQGLGKNVAFLQVCILVVLFAASTDPVPEVHGLTREDWVVSVHREETSAAALRSGVTDFGVLITEI